MNAALKEKLKTLPRTPGVYFHKSQSGEIIYVGKAAVLKNRVRQYFQSERSLDTKTIALVSEIYDTDWIETESEVDALFLESEMVKRYMPRYNVLLRDDKSQMFVRINMKDEWPHVAFTRNPADDGAEYIGPFYNGYAVKNALRYLRKVFPYYTREPNERDSKLEMQIGLNPKQSDGSEAYKASLRTLMSYTKGNRVAITRELEAEMKQAAEAQQFERAVVLRNKLHAMKELQRRVMFGDREFLQISKDKALAQLAELLMLPKLPARIEGYDISHQGGANVVASMVVFTNGVSDRAEYRKFKMAKQVNDDTGNMYDTLLRRLSEKNIKSWGRPDVLLIDGGKGQLAAAIRAQAERGTTIPVVSIAKREEEMLVSATGSNVSLEVLERFHTEPPAGVFVERIGDLYVVNLHVGQRNAGSHSKNLRGSSDIPSGYSDTVKLFQRIRDEAHRFAVSYHTTLKRSGAMKNSLEDIPGIGPKTRRTLLTKFGSLRALSEVDVSAIAAVVGQAKAVAIVQFLGAKHKQDDTLKSHEATPESQ